MERDGEGEGEREREREREKDVQTKRKDDKSSKDNWSHVRTAKRTS
jgi:hypothetical protein